MAVKEPKGKKKELKLITDEEALEIYRMNGMGLPMGTALGMFAREIQIKTLDDITKMLGG